MKSPTRALFVAAAMVLVQVAFADFAYEMPIPSKLAYVAPTLAWSKPTITHCSPKVIDKTAIAPYCPHGYQFDAKLRSCVKLASYKCSFGTLATSSDGGSVCLECHVGYTLSPDGECYKDCKKGYSLQIIKGARHCVEDCEEGFTAQGNECISSSTRYSRKECKGHNCLPLNKSYHAEPAAKKPVYTSGRKLAGLKPKYTAEPSAAVKPIYVAPVPVHKPVYVAPKPAAPVCECTLTHKRDMYAFKVKDPKVSPAEAVLSIKEPVCPKGDKAQLLLSGTCKTCPVGTEETVFAKCQYPCPASYTTCKLGFENLCIRAEHKYSSDDKAVCLEALVQKTMSMGKAPECPVASPSKHNTKVQYKGKSG